MKDDLNKTKKQNLPRLKYFSDQLIYFLSKKSYFFHFYQLTLVGKYREVFKPLRNMEIEKVPKNRSTDMSTESG